MIPTLTSTIEKPLTAIDYVAALEQCATLNEIAAFTDLAPALVRHDERFAKGVARRIAALQQRQAAA